MASGNFSEIRGEDDVAGPGGEVVGPESVRAAQDAAGGHHRPDGDRGFGSVAQVGADLSDLPRHAHEDHDHQGVSAQASGEKHIIISSYRSSQFWRQVANKIVQ